MADIIMSIHPKWAKKIYANEKWIEWRKSLPKNVDKSTKVFLYETSPVCKVTGYFKWTNEHVVFELNRLSKDEIRFLEERGQLETYVKQGCVPIEDLKKYQGGSERIYGWISKYWVKFDNPRTLSDFGLKRPPQSWQYLKEEN